MITVRLKEKGITALLMFVLISGILVYSCSVKQKQSVRKELAPELSKTTKTTTL